MMSPALLRLLFIFSFLMLGTFQDCIDCEFPMKLDKDGLCTKITCTSGQYPSSSNSTGCESMNIYLRLYWRLTILDCQVGCTTCNNASSCQSCSQGYTLQGSSCLQSSTACIDCEFPLKLDRDGLCTKIKCTSGQYPSSSNSTGCESMNIYLRLY